MLGATLVSLLSVGLVAGSLLYDGIATADVDLNDGGVWVTSDQEMRVGRLNHQVQLLDGSIASRSGDIDVRQDGQQVFLLDRGTGVLQQVDPAALVTTSNVTIPGDAQVELGGGTLAVLDPSTGALHTVPDDAAGTLADDDLEGAASLGAGAVMAVAPDGTTYGLSPDRATVAVVAAGHDPETDEVDELAVVPEGTDLPDGELQLSAVGQEPVALLHAHDGRALLLRPEAEPLDLSDVTDLEGARLQAPGEAGPEVIIAARDGMVHVPLADGDAALDPVEAPGEPSRPLVVAGCAHGAWGSGSMTYRVQCGSDEALDTDIPKRAEQPDLVLRANRDVVVLNDMLAGTVWLVQDAMEIVENWEDVTPPQRATEEEEDSQDEIEEQLPLDREEDNRDPVANDDDLGLRAGSTTILEVLANDTDPDGDLLTVTSFDGPPASLGEVTPVLGGRALQIEVPEDAAGGFGMRYSISDGRGGSDDATARLTVVPENQNRAPEQERPITMTLTSGASGSVNVLDDVLDPDGDEVVVVGAETSTDDVVRFTPDGVVTFIDSGVDTGTKPVVVTVSDGRAEAEIEVTADVRPTGSVPPVPVFDFVTAIVGQEVVVEPLANDIDPDGKELRLADVEQAPDASVVPDYDAGTFHFTAERATTYYLTYIVVSDAGQSATGLIRIDASEPAQEPPVAVQDTALLPAGGQVLVDVLDNDHDPGGGVLAVQGVDVPESSGLAVAVLEHRILKVSATGELTGPVRIGYEVSNGEQSAQGEAVVLPIPPDSLTQPPVAHPDVANVRAGDYVTIPVVANDSHPGGLEFSLSDDLVEEPEAGHMFVSGDTVRFRAPAQPQTVTGVYEIVDDEGQRASAQVTVYVQADDGERNSPPLPEPVEARAFAGERVRIQVPTFGIDPDGDSVQLLGADDAPTKGRIVEVGPTYIDYEAYARASGTDEFTYAVRDRLGAYATASMRVGVVPPPSLNRPPQAVDDEVHIRPGRKVEVDVLANDTDPDGDPLYLDDPAFDEVEGIDVEVVEGGRLQVFTEDEGDHAVAYHITDSRGGRDTGILTVRVDEDAPLLAPVAVDDIVQPASILGHERVTVPVLDNDHDPDGAREDLEVGLVDDEDHARVVGSEVQVDVQPTRQVLTYSITDVDGLTSYAFVDLPGLEDSGPVLRADAEPIVVATGETREIELDDHVVAVSGNDVRLTDASKVAATNSDGAPPVVGPTTLTFTSADGYAGPATLTFEVTDGESDDDPDGLTAVLTLDITVESDENQPPTFEGTEVSVAPGEEAVAIDLRQLADDPDPGDHDLLEFELEDIPEGIDADLDGTELTVSAPPDTPRGTEGEVALTVSDRQAEPVPGVVAVTVGASNRPLASVNDTDLGELSQGESESVDVLAGAYNPFPDEALEVTEAVVETGGGSATTDGSAVQVTAGDSDTGRGSVRYTVLDATGDAERAVQGRVTFSVIGTPERPSPPRVEEVRDRTVVLSWTAPADNGSPITGYRVEGSGVSQECATTTCTIDGLTNAVDYTFTVTATNEVGDSEPSGASAVARPDVKPAKPAAPRLTSGDGEVGVEWPTPDTRGSAVSSYDLQIAPSPGSGQVSVSGNSHTWSGLTNGQSYTVRVRAHNDAPDPSEWSAWSAPEVPAGPPDTPGAPSVERVDSPVDAQIRASWQAPRANGDPVAGYDVTVYRDGSSFKTMSLSGSQTSVVAAAPAGSDYTVRVAASNKAGTSATSSQSAAVRSFLAPDRVSSVSAQATGGNGTVDLTFSAPAANGEAISRYEYRLGSGGWQRLSGKRITGLTNGTSYTVQVRACNSYCGDASPASGSVVPYGALGNPSVSAAKTGADGKNAKFSWTLPDGNGRDITKAELRVNGGGWESVGTARTGSKTVTGSWDTEYTGQIRVTRADGATTNATAAVRTSKKPAEPDPDPEPAPAPASVTAKKGGSAQGQPNCSHAACAYLAVGYENLPRGEYTIEFHPSGESASGPWRSYTKPLSGDGTYEAPAYRGNPGETVRVTVEGQGVSLEDTITW